VPASQLEALHFIADRLASAKVEALLGGAFAIARHVGRWRGTKDVDFLIRPADRERAIATVLDAGLQDYFDELAYDRSWIFRAYRDDMLVDLIWTLPNHVTEVDDAWFAHAAKLTLNGRQYDVVPLEELIWVKLFVMQRDRCDWPDVINLIRTNISRVDWRRLLDRIGEQEPLLEAALILLQWVAPDAVHEVPTWIRERFHLHDRAPPSADSEERRAALLDSRPWYAAVLPPNAMMSP
jgi:hypothetical protein